METFMQDVRYAFRNLAKRSGFLSCHTDKGWGTISFGSLAAMLRSVKRYFPIDNIRDVSAFN